MRWQDRRESNNVEDRRQQGGGSGLPIGGKGRLILLV
ncbi:neutral zinc metallopeptidase, partial [Aeromonas caviae]